MNYNLQIEPSFKMKLPSLILFCLLATAFGSPILEEIEETFALNNKLSGRIVGGNAANTGAFPYQVSLQRGYSHFCGGSILNKHWILSAGHCFRDKNLFGKNVVVGTNNLKKGGDSFKIKRVIVHPQFNIMKLKNDLALIEIEGILEFSSNVKPISLPTYDIREADTSVVASGWGRLKVNGVVPIQLQYLNSKIFDHGKCKKFNLLVSETNICTFTKKGEGLCNGDSGGPIVAGEYQVGIVSWGNPCAKGSPDVHTRVFSYVDWINEKCAFIIFCYTKMVLSILIKKFDILISSYKNCRKFSIFFKATSEKMNYLTSLIVLCLLANSFATPWFDKSDELSEEEIFTNKLDGRIVGGSPAPEGGFPYQVSLQRNGKHFCGGSIINSQWILTAAHCLQVVTAEQVTVVAGTNNLTLGGTQYKAKRLVVHPNFDLRKIAGDIGLLEINGTITFNARIGKVSLPSTDVSDANTRVVVSGWGKTWVFGKVSLVLKSLETRILRHTFCRLFNVMRITDKNICTISRIGNGVCHGDSGGPLVANGVQIGVVSWGLPCALGAPDVYTRVYSYKDWIDGYVKN
ncbi:uncharacterized protein LOC127287634 [Leptopilina boulardi]|uniref:uncharacterized protein LOC127287634 n=1 Tax=Leptopilina boulardi TaxID=63433 RepID=UPI0021F51B2D|nr:uncharacterized protein LOC127287634 [Leptopilina boulardi]